MTIPKQLATGAQEPSGARMGKSTSLQSYTDIQLIRELQQRGAFTSSPVNRKVIESCRNNNIKLIATFGAGSPKGLQQCRECMQWKSDNNFSYYMARVKNTGFLSRSNALCSQCAKTSNKQRKEVLDNASIPPKPCDGDTFVNCNRQWSGNWHRHHVGDHFVSWLCGHCNMSFSDQRNKNAK